MVKHKLAIAAFLVFVLLANALPAWADEPTNPAGPSVTGREYAGKIVFAGPGTPPLTEADTARLASQIKSQKVSPLEIQQAWADGRVYNVTAAVNIRACAGVGCPWLATAYPGKTWKTTRAVAWSTPMAIPHTVTNCAFVKA